MQTTTERPAKPASLDSWRHMYQRDSWTIPELRENPPSWMAVMTGDGTILFGFITGLGSQWPSVVVEVHGSQMSIEVARGTLVHCLKEGRPIRV